MAKTPRSVRTARDNARARALGYESYYDWRAHDSGRRPPSAPRSTGEALARERGHRGKADLESLIKSGRVELVNTMSTVNARGKFGIDVLVTMDDGSTREFRISERQAPEVGRLIDDQGPDAPYLVGSPRTLKRFTDIDEDEFDDYDDWEDFEDEAAA